MRYLLRGARARYSLRGLFFIRDAGIVCGFRIRLPYNMTNREEDQLTAVSLRQRIGLTQRQIAQALDVRQSTVSDWERGVSIPNLPPSKIKRMLEVYKCTIDELIEAFETAKQNKNAGGDEDTASVSE